MSGRVQGVSFRANTARQARGLAVTGYARNLPDGRVEVLACGTAEAVAALIEWLHRGPLLARVDEIEVTPAQIAQVPSDFTTA